MVGLFLNLKLVGTSKQVSSLSFCDGLQGVMVKMAQAQATFRKKRVRDRSGRLEVVGNELVISSFCLQHPPSLNIFPVCGFNCASFSFIFHHNEDFAGPKQISGMSLAQVIIRIRPSRNLVLFRFCHSSLVVSSSFLYFPHDMDGLWP